MFKRKLTTCVLTLGLATTAFLALSMGGEGKKPPASEGFLGEVVMVYVNVSESPRAQVLENVEIIEIAGRQFLAGTVADTTEEARWAQGVRAAVAWNDVQLLFTMTEEEYREKLLQRLKSRNMEMPDL
jgi:hypothetical protein